MPAIDASAHAQQTPVHNCPRAQTTSEPSSKMTPLRPERHCPQARSFLANQTHVHHHPSIFPCSSTSQPPSALRSTSPLSQSCLSTAATLRSGPAYNASHGPPEFILEEEQRVGRRQRIIVQCGWDGHTDTIAPSGTPTCHESGTDDIPWPSSSYHQLSASAAPT